MMATSSTAHINSSPDMDALLAIADLLSTHSTKVMNENKTRTTIIPGTRPALPIMNEPSIIPRCFTPT